MRYLITFSYDGSDFFGYQKQDGLRTVEGELEKALFDINDHKETKVTSSGRTDRGVHALAQTAHFDLTVTITLYKLKCALNSLLPDDIHIFSTEIVDNDFHARYMVKKKRYEYLLNMGEYQPLERKQVYQYNKVLDVEKMQQAIKAYIGIHNFEAFVSLEAKKENYVREIYDAFIEREDEKVCFVFIGNGFMKYQVRNMVGVLLRIGNGKYSVDMVERILQDISLRNYILTAKPEGLYLTSVEY